MTLENFNSFYETLNNEEKYKFLRYFTLNIFYLIEDNVENNFEFRHLSNIIVEHCFKVSKEMLDGKHLVDI